MKLEAGKRYIRRDGEVTAPLRYAHLSGYAFYDIRTDTYYTAAGMGCIDGTVSNRDLLWEYETVEQPNPKPFVNPAVSWLYVALDNLDTNIGVCLREGRDAEAAKMALDLYCICKSIEELEDR